MRVTVHIDRLVLDGVPRHQGAAVGRTLQRELSRLLTTGDLPHAGAQQIAGTVPHQATPTGLGMHAARAIHQGLRK